VATLINNYIGKQMETFTTLLDIRNDIGDKINATRLDNWTERLHIGSEYNRLSRAIEAYLGIDKITAHDMPETLEQLKAWYAESEGLAAIFNDAVREHGIPVTLIEETIAA
tara:strand:+ start:536 stop:868 length:333 start_codon:yes stop_codon:yes gene_type:complete